MINKTIMNKKEINGSNENISVIFKNGINTTKTKHTNLSALFFIFAGFKTSYTAKRDIKLTAIFKTIVL